MLIEKTIKVEDKVNDLGARAVEVAKKVVAGEAPGALLLEILGELLPLVSDAVALPGELEESLSGVLRSVALTLSDVVCVFLKKEVA